MGWNAWIPKFEKKLTDEEKVDFRQRAEIHVELLNRLGAYLSPRFPSPQRNRYGEGGSFANEVGKIHDTLRLVGIITATNNKDLDIHRWPEGTELPAELVLPKVQRKKDPMARNEIQWAVIPKKNIQSPLALLEALEKNIYPEEVMHALQGRQEADVEIDKK